MPNYHFQTVWLIPQNARVLLPDRAEKEPCAPKVESEGIAWKTRSGLCDYIVQWADIKKISAIDEKNLYRDFHIKIPKECCLRLVQDKGLLLGISIKPNLSRIFRLLWTEKLKPSYAESSINLSDTLNQIPESAIVGQLVESITIQHLAIENVLASSLVINNVSVYDLKNLIQDTDSRVSSITLSCNLPSISKIQISALGSFKTQGPTDDWEIVLSDVLELVEKLALLRRNENGW